MRHKKFKKYEHRYLACFSQETWELLHKYVKAYPFTKDGLVNSVNKTIHECVNRKLKTPKMKEKLKNVQVNLDQNGED